MAKPTVDGPGQAKLQVLDSATSIAQTLHGTIEKYAIAVRTKQPTTAYPQMIKRIGTPLIGMLRSQFQLLGDLSVDIVNIATRGGGGEQSKIRMLRERVAQLKSGIELAVTSTRSKHAVADARAPSDQKVHGEA